MANEIHITVKSGYDAAGLQAFRRDFDNLKSSVGEADDKIQAYGDNIEHVTTNMTEADKATTRLRDSTRQARDEFGRFTSTKKIKADDLIDPKVGAGFLGKFGRSLEDGIAKAPVLGQVGAAIGVAMAPTLGATLAAAVVGGSGLAGIAGGMVMAARDERVGKAATDLSARVGADFSKSSEVFVPVWLKAIDRVRKGYAELSPLISQTFTKLAPMVDPLVGKIVHAVQMIATGWASAAQNSGPVIDAIGNLAEKAGYRIGQMFDTLAKDGPQAASAINDISGYLDQMLVVTTATIDGLAKLKGGLDNVNNAISKARYWYEDHTHSLDITADGYKRGSEAAELYRQGIIGARGTLNDYDHYLQKVKTSTDDLTESQTAAGKAAEGQRSALADLANELKAQTDPVFGLISAQRKLASAQKNTKKAADDYGKKSPEYRDALNAQAQAAIDLEGKVGALSDSFNGRLSPAMRNTLRTAGFTKGQINDLEREFREAKRSGDAFARRYRATVQLANSDNVSAGLKQLIREANALAGSYTVKINYLTFGKPYSDAGVRSGNIGGLAHGGVMGAAAGRLAGGLTWVGEHGPELAQLPIGSRVWSNPDSYRLMNANTQSAPGQLSVVGINREVEQTLVGVLLRALRLAISDQGGNVQRVLGTAYS